MMTWKEFPYRTFVRSEREGVIAVEACLDPRPSDEGLDVYDVSVDRVLEGPDDKDHLTVLVPPSEDPVEACIAELEPYLGHTVDCGDPELLDPIGRAAERARVRASGPDEIAEAALRLFQSDHDDEWYGFFRSQVENDEEVLALIEEHFRSYVREYLDETA